MQIIFIKKTIRSYPFLFKKNLFYHQNLDQLYIKAFIFQALTKKPILKILKLDRLFSITKRSKQKLSNFKLNFVEVMKDFGPHDLIQHNLIIYYKNKQIKTISLKQLNKNFLANAELLQFYENIQFLES